MLHNPNKMKTIKDLKPLIDGDVLTYRCGFAADSQIKNEFKLAYPDWNDETLKEYIAETDYEANAFQNVKTVLDALTTRFSDEYKLYLHREGNFREQIASLKVYKGNRDPNAKPKYYEQIKEYMFEHWKAVPVLGMESDDAIGIEQFDNPDKYTVICSIDKDMLLIPGWHYNWVKTELKYQPIANANLFLFYQMLVGDSTDNIPGIAGIGDKRAKALIEAHDNDIGRVREAVKDLYRKQYGDMWEQAYHEIGSLLYILRKPEEMHKGCPLL